MSDDGIFASLETSLAKGDVTYTGSYLFFPTVPLVGTTKETISASSLKLGTGFTLSTNVMLTPYVELGYRYWERDLGFGQVEKYQNFETLGGAMLQYSPINRLTLTGYGAAGTTFKARMLTNPDNFELGNAGVYKVGGKIGMAVSDRIELFTTVDYNHFRYVKSDVSINGFYEPTSHTNETTARVGVAYHFH